MKDLLNHKSALILLGTGGVGKTTIAAALGIAAAIARLDTIVITVDPAHRLRDALGIERLSFRPVRLEGRRLRAAGLDPSLRLSAMMLDVKRTWDSLVERFVRNPASRRNILDNSFYRSLTEQFAGAEAYAVLEQLYDLHSGGRFDLEVVDTPPAAHAFEFFQAPAHLVRLLDSPAARWLFLPYASASSSVLGLAGRAVRFVISQLESYAGVQTLKSVSEFFEAAADATSAVSRRFRKTETLLRSPNLHFVLVTTPEEDRLNAARAVINQMQEVGLKLRAIVLNRTLDEPTFDAFLAAPRKVPAHLAEVGALRTVLMRENPHDQRMEALTSYLEAYRANQQATVERAARFARELPPRVRLAVVPEVEVGVRDLRALAKIASILVNENAGRRFLENAAAAFAPRSSARPENAPRRATG
ncbi:MAG TPA: ArsA-related P-loop ATPase [Candidatus Binataceae bacterium]|nr:ArsA-related P-loop ATPase [Candidatus Binataceae bacterium]